MTERRKDIRRRGRMRRVLGISSATDRGWLLWAARFGYAACGFIYVVVGAFALAVSLGVREEPTGLHGVMRFLARQPFSPFLLATLAIGLAGYAALNITGAITDPERRGFSFIALIQRAADILTGALYIGLAFAALSLIVGVSGNTDAATAVSRKLLAIPFGPTIIRLAGISLLVGSVYLFIRAATEEFGEMLDKRSLSRRVRNAIELAARAGTAARAVVFAICGVYAI